MTWKGLKAKVAEEFSIAPGAMLLGIYAALSFFGVCMYWMFGTNDWVKIGLCPGWLLSVAAGMQVALMVDLK